MASYIRRALVAVVGASALLLAGGCGASGGSGDDGEPRAGGTITVGLLADALGLDPHMQPNQQSTWVSGLVYSRLLDIDENLKITGDLAETWKQDSPTSYTFTLRKGVKFHNGRELTSQDVVYSLDRVRDKKTASSKAYWFASIDKVAAPDPTTVTVTLKTPDAALTTHLANPVASIVPKEVVDKEGDLNKTMVGSGPFTFVSHTPASKIVLKRNPNYFIAGTPKIDDLVLKPIEDENARMNALRSGDIDLTTHVPPNVNDSLSKEPGLTLSSPRSGQFYAMFLQADRAPFDNPKVREALIKAVDREALVKGVLFDKGLPLNNGPLPPWHPLALDEKINTGADLDASKRLLAAAGFTSANVTIGLWSGQTFAVNAAQLIQQTVKPLGINIEIKQYGDFASYNKAVFVDKQHNMTIQGFGGKLDANDWLADAFATGSRQNTFGYSDPALDKFLEEGRAASDDAGRKKAYDGAQRILAKDGPAVFLFNMDQPDAVAERVKGYVHRPDLQLNGLAQAWVTR